MTKPASSARSLGFPACSLSPSRGLGPDLPGVSEALQVDVSLFPRGLGSPVPSLPNPLAGMYPS